ncbi:MAG: SDR family NAD(P)-dependent oxidoreductase, partial [Candidatus Dadabacteria bacterium]
PAVPSYLPGQDAIGTLARVYAVQESVAGTATLQIGDNADPAAVATTVATPSAAPSAAPQAATADILATVREIVADASGYELEEIEPGLDFEADLGIDTVKIAEIVGLVRERFGLPEDPDLVLSDVATADAIATYVAARQRSDTSPAEATEPRQTQTAASTSTPSAPPARAAASAEVDAADILDAVRQIVADASGYDLDEIEPDLDFEADLGIDTVKIAEIVGLVRERFGLPEDPDLVLSDVASAATVAAYVAERQGASAVLSATAEPVETEDAPRADPSVEPAAVPALADDEIVISGMAAAIPGHPDPFSADALASLLSGDNLIEPVPDAVRDRIIELGIESVSKDSEGRVRTQTIRNRDETVQYRSRLHGEPDLTAFGIPKAAAQILDRSSRWAVAAGFHALNDAALPLIDRDAADRYAAARVLPAELGARTGVIYASIFGGIDVWLDAATGKGSFPRTFMVESLSLAHSHFARFVGASGPTMRLDAACASTVTALATAQDWLQNNRCDRVVIIACDLAGEDTLLPYVGGGFMAVGAASTDPDLERAARPFGTGRAGTIIGSAALAIVLEKAGQARERGLRPHARLAAVRTSNDACHPLQMNPTRIAEQLDNLIDAMTERYELERAQIARRGAFVSHEPYTPARGGSAASEANALRNAFGQHVGDIPVINVKGYTGHPMAASIEDIVAIAALVHGKAPAVRNADKQDPELADLRLSDGSPVACDWVIHLAAGFGAQIGWVGYGRVPGTGPRIDRDAWHQWTSQFNPRETAVKEPANTVAADHAAVLSWTPDWRRRDTASATVSPGAVWQPLADRTIFDASDVEQVVADVIRYCCEQAPDTVLLPVRTADRWTHIAAEAIAAAVRSLRKESDNAGPRLVWAESALPDQILDVAEQRWDADQVAERVWVPSPQRNARATAPAGNWILIGGGRGITGLLARRWAAVPDRTLILVGRQEAPDDALADLDDATLKQRARAELGGEKDPKRYQAIVARLERARELARTLRELRDAPSTVRYVAVDIARPGAADAIAATLDDIGPVAGIIHAAGVEASVAANRTSLETVQRVMLPKLSGGLEILRLAQRYGHVPVIGFGSIAAAIGNHGQSAYGAANAALRALFEAANIPATTIEWSAWGGAGMATRGAIPELLKRQGISLMDPDAAFSELEAWLSGGSEQRPAAVVVAATEDAGGELPAPPDEAAACIVSGPGDPWIDDHRIGGVAVQPGVSGLAMLWNLRPHEGVSLEYRRAIRFNDDHDALISIVNHNGHGHIVEHDDANRPRRQPAWTYEWKGDARPDAPVAFSPETSWTAGPQRQDIYALLFHGPRFQVLDDCWFTDGGAFGSATVSDVDPARQHAMAVEALFQLGGLWGAWKHGRQYLPVGVWTHRLDPAASVSKGTIRVACIGGDEQELRFRGAWHNENGILIRTAEFSLRAAGDSERPTCRPVGALVETVPVPAGTDRRAAQRQASAEAWQQVIGRVWTGLTGAPLDTIDTAEAPGPLRHGGYTIAWSRTHTDHLAAAAARPGEAIGIDAETVQERPNAFWQQATGSRERTRFPASPSPETMAMLWTAKEATLKAAGTGLSVPLADLDVSITGPDSATVTIAERQQEALGFSAAHIHFVTLGDTLIAVAQPEIAFKGA